MFATFLLTLTPQQAMNFMHSICPRWGKKVVQKIYCEDCTLNYENIMDKMDRFVFAHFFGWLFKALIIRDRLMLWLMSFIWELTELSLLFYVPNFAECWWDSWILDFLVCNGIGIEVGLKFNNYLEEKEYKWSGIMTFDTLCGKFNRVCAQFGPAKYDKIDWYSWTVTEIEWEPRRSLFRYVMSMVTPIIFVFAAELNGFFLKINMGIPTEDNFNTYRILLFSALALPCSRQMYLYVTDPKCSRLGSQAWIYIITQVVEILVNYKNAEPLPPIPFKNKVAWAIGGGLFMFVSYILTTRRKVGLETTKRQGS